MEATQIVNTRSGTGLDYVGMDWTAVNRGGVSVVCRVSCVVCVCTLSADDLHGHHEY